MLFVCCQLLKYSRGVSWTEGVSLTTGSHTVTWECNNPLGRFCCISPGNHSWHYLIHFVCPWSHIWSLVRKNRLILSKRGPKSKHRCRVEAQQTRTQNDLENWAIPQCWCAEGMRVPWAAPGIRVSRGFHQLGMDRTRAPSPAVSQVKWRCSTGSGQSFLYQESPPGSKRDPHSEGSFCSSSSRDKS